MNVVADNDELLKYIKTWNKKFNKKGLYNEYIKTRISPYNENFHGNKKRT